MSQQKLPVRQPIMIEIDAKTQEAISLIIRSSDPTQIEKFVYIVLSKFAEKAERLDSDFQKYMALYPHGKPKKQTLEKYMPSTKKDSPICSL